jgi:hypothetical protein
MVEDDVRQGEYIGGPFEKFVSERFSGQGTPRRSWRWFPRW